VQAKHSATQGDHYDAARKFIGKLMSVANYGPGLVGMFLANGSIDDDLLRILRGSGISNLRWFDLTDRDVMDKIRAEIATIGGQPAAEAAAAEPAGPATAVVAPAPASPSAIEIEAAKLREMNAELERKLRELDDRRNQETMALKERLDKVSQEVSAPRYVTITNETRINPEREHASYQAMLEEPSFDKKLRYVGSPLLTGLAAIALGLFVLLEEGPLAALAFGPYAPERFLLVGAAIFAGIGISISIAGIWVIWRGYSQVAEYFEFSRQTLRDLYLRDLPIDVLARVNTILRESINRYGARRGRSIAIKRFREGHDGLPAPVRFYFEEMSQ
jgi:hypothetical protein